MSERYRSSNKKGKALSILASFILLIIYLSFSYYNSAYIGENNVINEVNRISYNYSNIDQIPEYQGNIYVTINNNVPDFSENDYTVEAFETYSPLDYLGRCGVAYANICKEIMPKSTEQRGDISNVKPTGWKQAKYDNEFLYNRCHLIGYQLAAENDNELNLITGTRYFNVEGMLPFENQVADYVKTHKKVHVLYRVTPIFKDDNLLANGVQMEAFSVEDMGESVSFNVFVYNVQPKVTIDYTTGASKAS